MATVQKVCGCSPVPSLKSMVLVGHCGSGPRLSGRHFGTVPQSIDIVTLAPGVFAVAKSTRRAPVPSFALAEKLV